MNFRAYEAIGKLDNTVTVVWRDWRLSTVIVARWCILYVQDLWTSLVGKCCCLSYCLNVHSHLQGCFVREKKSRADQSCDECDEREKICPLNNKKWRLENHHTVAILRTIFTIVCIHKLLPEKEVLSIHCCCLRGYKLISSNKKHSTCESLQCMPRQDIQSWWHSTLF